MITLTMCTMCCSMSKINLLNCINLLKLAKKNFIILLLLDAATKGFDTTLFNQIGKIKLLTQLLYYITGNQCSQRISNSLGSHREAALTKLTKMSGSGLGQITQMNMFAMWAI